MGQGDRNASGRLVDTIAQRDSILCDILPAMKTPRFDPSAVHGHLRGGRTRLHARARRAVGARAGQRRAEGHAGHGQRGPEALGDRDQRGRKDHPRRDGQSQPGRLRGPSQAAHPAGCVAAVPLQPAGAGDAGQQDAAADSPERGAEREASVESRRRRVLAAAQPRRAGSHQAGHLARVDRDVSGAAASLQPAAEQRRHVPRRLRPRRSEARRRRDRRGQVQGPAARHPVGREGHHLGEGLQDHVGIERVQGPGPRLRRVGGGAAARRGRGVDREGHHRRARRRRQLVRRADQEPVGSHAGVERIVGGTLVCHGRRMHRVRHRHRDERIDSESGRALRPGRPCVRRSAASAATA